MDNYFSAENYYAETGEFLAAKVEGITETINRLKPSEWAEKHRILPRSLSAQPGPYSFDATPYLREIIDCLDPDHPCRMLAMQKGAQIGATVGIAENWVGYVIEHLRTYPMIFASADDGLTKQRIETNIIPMLQNSDLYHLMQSNDEQNKRKSGVTGKMLSWVGGGYMLPVGGASSNKMRSNSVPYLLRDETSGWPLTVGRDADPLKLTETRTNSFETTRKIVDLSTPNETATDAISKRFALGDQRYYQVPCKSCGGMQNLRFRGVNKKTGAVYGLIWELDEGRVVTPGSVRYVCRHCQYQMINEDKVTILGGGEWVPTAKPSNPAFYSYHLNALYAPHFARTWEAIARDWVQCWDDEANLMIDGEGLQVFYNNDLGEPFEVKADKLKEHQISPHRRTEFSYGRFDLVDAYAEQHTGGRIEFVSMAVDVQKTFLSIATFAWSPSADNAGYNSFLLNYWTIDAENDTESIDDPCWQALAELIDNKRYTTTGREFPINMTLIDASYLPDTVHAFCDQWDAGVYPLRGRDKPLKGSGVKEFAMAETSAGRRYVSVTVDLYKDRWSAQLKRQWNGIDKMPRGALSLPTDIENKHVKELAVEWRREKKDPSSGKLLGTYWYRPGNARQELWDLLQYATAALEMVCFDTCVEELQLEVMIWPEFWANVTDTNYEPLYYTKI